MSPTSIGENTEAVVWQVFYSDCRHEGGGVEAVFSTYEKALAYALARVEMEREDGDATAALRRAQWVARGADPELEREDWRPFGEWKQEGPDQWGDGMQLITVYEQRLDDESILAERTERHRAHVDWLRHEAANPEAVT